MAGEAAQPMQRSSAPFSRQHPTSHNRPGQATIQPCHETIQPGAKEHKGVSGVVCTLWVICINNSSLRKGVIASQFCIWGSACFAMAGTRLNISSKLVLQYIVASGMNGEQPMAMFQAFVEEGATEMARHPGTC